MDQEQFLKIARSVKIGDQDTRYVWEALLDAVQAGEATPDLMLEMLATLSGASGRMGYNELSLDDDIEAGGDGHVAVLTSGSFSGSMTCSKKELLNAYQQLLETLHY